MKTIKEMLKSRKSLFTVGAILLLFIMLLGGIVGCKNDEVNNNDIVNNDIVNNDGIKDEKIVHTVTFDSNGGSPVGSITVPHGEKIRKPDAPSRDGYDFVDWFYGDERWSFIGYSVTEDMTLVADWKIKNYSVSIVTSFGDFISRKTYDYGSKVEIDNFYCPRGYYISGYSLGGNVWDLDRDVVVKDMVLVVELEKYSYTVSFDSVGGGSYEPITVYYGDLIPIPNDPYKFEEVFQYWSYNGAEWDFYTTRVYNDITLTAEYDKYVNMTVLRMATGYNSFKTGISFDSFVAGEGITLADGVTYHTGDLKPTWVELQKILNVVFEDKYQGNHAQKEFQYWQDQLDQVDMVSGTATQLSEAGVAGKLVNLADYLDDMPNFKNYLYENPVVLLSISSMDENGDIGGIYFTPYFDGVNDIERVPLMRIDWVVKLLDGSSEFTALDCNNLASAVYTPYMPTSGKVEVDVVKLNASGTEQITKDYDAAGNIIANMNAALAAGNVSGVEAVNMLRDYIDVAYGGYYGYNRSNLFVGQNAAWDADELVALLRCVVANPQTLNGTNSVNGLFSREDDNNQRRVDMFRFAGTLFGVRGLESRQDYLYVGADGLLHDARQEADTYIAMERMNAMVQEGLISSSFVNKEDTDTGVMLQNDAGFMHYDYNQTQTVYNEIKLDEGEMYRAAMIPVARWNDGTGEVFMRFTESWRSVKTDGWAISKAGVGNDTNKLHAALALIDYAYSEKGQILMSYGPDAFIKTNADGSYVTFDFNGKQMPVIADETYDELWDLAYGNYTNYARMYLGSTLSFVKSQAFEYQCTHVVGKEGMAYISTAIEYGTIKHPELAITDNPWWSIVPTTLPNTKVENDEISKLTELSSTGKFSQANRNENILIDIIIGGYAGEGLDSRNAVLNTVKNTYGGEIYLAYKQDAYDRLLEYANTIK